MTTISGCEPLESSLVSLGSGRTAASVGADDGAGAAVERAGEPAGGAVGTAVGASVGVALGPAVIDVVGLGVGAAVGRGVGALVGRGVGALVGLGVTCGVGDAVGAGVALALTVTVIVIDVGWTSQWPRNVPTVEKVRGQLQAAFDPDAFGHAANPSQWMLCGTVPAALVTVTVSPTVIVTALLLKPTPFADAVIEVSAAETDGTASIATSTEASATTADPASAIVRETLLRPLTAGQYVRAVQSVLAAVGLPPTLPGHDH